MGSIEPTEPILKTPMHYKPTGRIRTNSDFYQYLFFLRLAIQSFTLLYISTKTEQFNFHVLHKSNPNWNWLSLFSPFLSISPPYLLLISYSLFHSYVMEENPTNFTCLCYLLCTSIQSDNVKCSVLLVKCSVLLFSLFTHSSSFHSYALSCCTQVLSTHMY